jgi:hypothetical protein
MATKPWDESEFNKLIEGWLNLDLGDDTTTEKDDEHFADCFDCRATDYALEAVEVLISKHKDYGPTNISDAPGGALNGLRVRLHDKVARLNNLIDKGVDPQHESLFDTFLDIANYGLIGMMILENDWDEK